MLMRYDIQLQTMIKAMVETVMPAVDPLNVPAQEQSRLVIGTLMLMAEQLPVQYQCDRNELAGMIAFAEEIASCLEGCSGTIAEALSGLTATAHSANTLLSRPGADPADLLAMARAIRSELDLVIDVTFTEDEAQAWRADVANIVLTQSQNDILRQRVWARSQGFEPADDLPSIESLATPSNSQLVTND